MLTEQQILDFENAGHVTVPDVFDDAIIAAARDDIARWGIEFLEQMQEEQRAWYLETSSGRSAIRKLDNPVIARSVFRDMAKCPTLVAMVEQLIGKGVFVFFSQVFCKPPEVGGPKPVHQDNFFFGPSDPDAMLTVWIAIDDAVVENGCLYYGDGSHRSKIYPHAAPSDQPFNLQIDARHHSQYTMVPAQVPAGGISLHHGNTWHQSSRNASRRPRRAAAFHYLRNSESLVRPALEYDRSSWVKIT